MCAWKYEVLLLICLRWFSSGAASQGGCRSPKQNLGQEAARLGAGAWQKVLLICWAWWIISFKFSWNIIFIMVSVSHLHYSLLINISNRRAISPPCQKPLGDNEYLFGAGRGCLGDVFLLSHPCLRRELLAWLRNKARSKSVFPRVYWWYLYVAVSVQGSKMVVVWMQPGVPGSTWQCFLAQG